MGSNSTLILDGLLKLSVVTSWSSGAPVLEPGSNCLIEGIGTIDGNASSQTVSAVMAGISADGISRFVARGITIQNTKNWPWNVTSSSNCFAIDCAFLNGGSSVEFAISGDNCWFVNCDVSGINDLGVGHYGGFTNSGTIGCRVTSCSSCGPFSFNDRAQPGVPSNILIVNNIVSLCGSGVSVASNVGSGSGPSHTKVSGNTCFSNLGPGIVCTTDQSTSIVDNTCWGNNTSASSEAGEIQVGLPNGTMTGGVVADNLILNPGGGAQAGYGIQIYLPNQVAITGNVILDIRTTPTMISGLYGPTGQRCFVNGNTIFGATGTPDAIIYGFYSTQGFSYEGNAVGVTGTLSGSPWIDGLPAFVGNSGGKTSGFQTQGLSFCWNLTSGVGECDIIGAGGTTAGSWNGLHFYGVDNTGEKVIGPMSYGAFAKLTGTGLLQVGSGFQQGDSGPTWTTGIGVPSSTQPVGSLYSRTDGADGSRLYVSAGEGAWNAVSGV